MTYQRLLLSIITTVGLLVVRPAGAGTTNNGTFGFLTESLPEGTMNA